MYVAPVTGGIADRKQDWLVLALGVRQGVGAPGAPMDRVVLVLLQIGAGFFGEAVAGHGDPCEERRADGPVNGPRPCGQGAGPGSSPTVKASEIGRAHV